MGYDVYAVEASDIEGGDLTFTFANGQLEMGVATINETSGLITLTSALDFEADVSYEVSVAFEGDVMHDYVFFSNLS